LIGLAKSGIEGVRGEVWKCGGVEVEGVEGVERM